jgi:FHA domain-containing protein
MRKRAGSISAWKTRARRLSSTRALVRVLVVALLLPMGISLAQTAPPANGAVDTKAVSDLMLQALHTSDPAARIKIYEDVIKLDPNNTQAYNEREKAVQEIQKNKQDAADKQRKDGEARAKETEGKKAIDGAEKAFYQGNYGLAQQLLQQAQQLIPGNPAVQRVTQMLRYTGMVSRFRYVAFGGVAILAGTLVGFFLWIFAKRQPFLEAMDGEVRGMRYPVDKEVTAIGAVPELDGQKNDIVLTDRKGLISRIHCEIHWTKGKLYVVDCQSSNGTFVDGRRIPAGRMVPLGKGDRVELAKAGTLKVGFRRKGKS